MHVKLRPGSHFVPTTQGVRCSRGDELFLLAGPPALFTLIDSHLAALSDGTTLDALLAAGGGGGGGGGGGETVRPVLSHLLRTLLDRGLLFDLDDAGGPPPDPATAERLADLLSFVEEHCARPYAALRSLSAAQVAVAGDRSGPAAASLYRSLAERALTPRTIAECSPAPTLIVLLDSGAGPAAETPPTGVPVLALVTGPDLTVVGPVLPDVGALPAFRAAADRIARWQTGDPADAATGPVGAALAGSLAAQRVLTHLTGVSDVTADSLVVHGRLADITAVPLPRTDPTTTSDPTVAADPATAADPSVAGDPATAADPVASGDAGAAADVAIAGLTARFRGVARLLPATQARVAPLRIALARPVASAGPDVTGWGTSVADAQRGAVLSAMRAMARSDRPDPAAVAAAGLSTPHFLLDGALRLLGRELLGGDPAGAPLPVSRLAPGLRVLLRTLVDYYDLAARIHLDQPAGAHCWLARVVDGAGDSICAAQWGPSPASAVESALHASVAAAQCGVKSLEVDPAADTGTRAWELRPQPEVTAQLARMRDTRPLRSSRWPGTDDCDAVAGWVWWR